jgi:hypothetical protein
MWLNGYVERLHLLLATVKNLLLASVRPNSSQQNYIVLSGSKGWWCTLLDIRSLPIYLKTTDPESSIKPEHECKQGTMWAPYMELSSICRIHCKKKRTGLVNTGLTQGLINVKWHSLTGCQFSSWIFFIHSEIPYTFS